MTFKTCLKHQRTYNTKLGCIECILARSRKTKVQINKVKPKYIKSKIKKKRIRKKPNLCQECNMPCQGTLCSICFRKQNKTTRNVLIFLQKLKSDGVFVEKPKKEKTFLQTVEEMNKFSQ